MRTRIGWLLVLLAVALVPGRLRAQSDATLVVTTDLDCSWALDGHDMGTLKAGDSQVVPVSLGKHAVFAQEFTEFRTKWQTVVNVTHAGQETVEIKLKAEYQQRVADLQQNPAWKDPATGLMWARQDNDMYRTLNLDQAGEWCRNATTGGYSNWRLPTIDELSGIHDQARNVYGDQIKGGIRATGEWSSSRGGNITSGMLVTERPWYYVYSFVDGKRLAAEPNQDAHALCVRDTVETVPSGAPRKVRGARGERGSR